MVVPSDISATLSKTTVAIASDHSFAKGVILWPHAFIATSYAAVSECASVSVRIGNKQLHATVVFWDPTMDQALLFAPQLEELSLEKIQIDSIDTETCYAINDKEEAVSLILNDTDEQLGKFPLFATYSNQFPVGGPVFSATNKLVALTTWDALNQRNLFIPATYLNPVLEGMSKPQTREGMYCTKCDILIFKESDEDPDCPTGNCTLDLPSKHADASPTSGVFYTIEEILQRTGHNPLEARKGKGNWFVQQGSAKIHINYYPRKGAITGEAQLCHLPVEKRAKTLEFMLRQNAVLEGLTFGLDGQIIVLSLNINDRYLNLNSGLLLLQQLFEKADHYDDILVNSYGASWI